MKSLICFLFLPLMAIGQNSFKFIPDAGVRLDSVSISHAFLENDTFFLYHNSGPIKGLAISTDGLNFTNVNVNDYPRYSVPQMPNGVYRKYGFQSATNTLKSDSSTNRIDFFPETGIRYQLPASDSGFYGVSTFYNDPFGGVYLIYIGGQGPTHFCKSAYSPPGDNGMNFNLQATNIFNDSTFGGSSFSHVDPFALSLPDGSVRVFTMNQHGPPFPPAFREGYIYSFHSTDGVSFAQEFDNNGDSLRLTYTDFTEFTVYSLNDPKVVRLDDGRFRMYIKALIEVSPGNLKSAIISATTELATGITEEWIKSDLVFGDDKGNVNS